MDNINTFELSDEQLEMVAGGGQTNSSGSANIAVPTSSNLVLGSVLVDSPIGSSVIPQTNVTCQTNSKSTYGYGCGYYC